MLISVITVTYNALPSLKRTLQSVWEQSYPDVECIVVDGASTDGTPEYLATLKPSIPLFYTSAPDRGIYDAMNQAVGRIRGDHVLFLNCGDTFRDENVLRDVHDAIVDRNSKEGTTVPAIYYGDMSGLATKFSEELSIQVLREVYAAQHAIGVVGWIEFDAKVQDQQKIAVLKMGT